MTYGLIALAAICALGAWNFSAAADEPKAKPLVVFETSEGNITIEVDTEKAPISAENFLTYVDAKFYDGLVFHRVIPGFMIQGGGFDETFYQGKFNREKQTRDPIKNEGGNGLKNLRGTLSMARTSDPDSATSQFFINVADNDFLNRSPGNPGYAVFGKVVEGMDVADKIVAAPRGRKGPHDDVPNDPIVIKSAKRK